MEQGRKSRSELLKRLALDAGFDRAGVATGLPQAAWEAYEAWLAAGLHGPLGYMAAQREARRSLESLLPGARAVLMVALGYVQQPRREAGRPKIARYALGRDYHKVLRSKLRRVAAAAERE
ncbi:MAG: DUF1730 domain-containing protein, partial [Fimbriimonadales bacterium]|nr:DUF1730 domain-containing protein [Fimbriimonadales bacterium]